MFNETAADLRSIGVECAALVQTNTPLPASVVSVLYDCLYDFATVANAASDAVLMLFASSKMSGASSCAQCSTRAMLKASAWLPRLTNCVPASKSIGLNIPSRPILRRRRLSRYVPLSTKGGQIMGVLSHMPLVVLLALLSVFFLAAFTQAVHVLFVPLRGVKCRLPG